VKKIWALAGAALAVSLILAAGAFAFAIKKATKPAPPDVATTATAECPPSSQVAQGGFTSTVGIPQGTLISALGLKGPRLWAARVEDFGAPGSVTSVAYCGPVAKTTKVVKSGTVQGGSTGGVTATCPKGRSVRNGGFSGGILGSEFDLVSEQRLGQRKWKVTAFNNEMGSIPVKAIAYCGKGPKLTTFSKSADLVASGDVTAVAKCGKDKTLVMGGFAHTTPGDAFIKKLVRPGKRSWAAGIFGFDPATVRAFAYCA